MCKQIMQHVHVTSTSTFATMGNRRVGWVLFAYRKIGLVASQKTLKYDSTLHGHIVTFKCRSDIIIAIHLHVKLVVCTVATWKSVVRCIQRLLPNASVCSGKPSHLQPIYSSRLHYGYRSCRITSWIREAKQYTNQKRLF
jgi:hypothetical protein